MQLGEYNAEGFDQSLKVEGVRTKLLSTEMVQKKLEIFSDSSSSKLGRVTEIKRFGIFVKKCIQEGRN